ncbi:sigma-70 family RNA polymerase sigma factor [Oleiharenicola sp. Vm1]|uniref:sigma-70 family RNA polymerase sigma factor n=1 Tax=Oleiharenicola sp. Vm1 TaxID=3398393 RepID=UPI0039F60078
MAIAMPLHHVIWTEANGPIPDGCNLYFKDGDNQNCRLSNIVCAPIADVTRATATGDNQFTKARQAAAVAELDGVLRGMAANKARRHFDLCIDASDLAQAGRIAVANAARRFAREKLTGPWRPYVIAAARNAMASWVRKHGRNVRTPANKFFTAGVSEISIQAPVTADSDSSTFEELFLGQDETTTGSVDRTAMFQTLAKRMKRLPAGDRALLHAYYFKEQTLHQIAVGLGVTRQAIHLRMKRIIATLRRSRNLKRVKREVAA